MKPPTRPSAASLFSASWPSYTERSVEGIAVDEPTTRLALEALELAGLQAAQDALSIHAERQRSSSQRHAFRFGHCGGRFRAHLFCRPTSTRHGRDHSFCGPFRVCISWVVLDMPPTQNQRKRPFKHRPYGNRLRIALK